MWMLLKDTGRPESLEKRANLSLFFNYFCIFLVQSRKLVVRMEGEGAGHFTTRKFGLQCYS